MSRAPGAVRLIHQLTVGTNGGTGDLAVAVFIATVFRGSGLGHSTAALRHCAGRLLPALSLALALGAAGQSAQAQSAAEPGNLVATVLPSVTQTDRRALMASFIDRLGPSCLEKGKRFGADPAAFAPTAWSRGFYRTDDISETVGGTAGLEYHPDHHTCAGFGFNYATTDLDLSGLPQSGGVEAFTLGAYARRDGAIVFVDGAAAATYAAIDSKRHFAGRTATGKSDATSRGHGWDRRRASRRRAHAGTAHRPRLRS